MPNFLQSHWGFRRQKECHLDSSCIGWDVLLSHAPLLDTVAITGTAITAVMLSCLTQAYVVWTFTDRYKAVAVILLMHAPTTSTYASLSKC